MIATDELLILQSIALAFVATWGAWLWFAKRRLERDAFSAACTRIVEVRYQYGRPCDADRRLALKSLESLSFIVGVAACAPNAMVDASDIRAIILKFLGEDL